MAHELLIYSFSRLSEYGNKFWETLYKKMISKRPDTLKYFENADMHHLYTMLSKSVTYVVLNSSSQSVQSESYFKKIIDTHNQKFQIPKSYVQDWRDCLIETIQELDSELTTDELQIWIETIDILVEPIGVKL